MKKTIIILVSIFIASFSLQAQTNFQNNGFESWSSSSSPSNWNTLGYSGLSLCGISKSTQAHSGSYAAGIAPKQLPYLISVALGIEQFAVPGLLTNATINFEALMSLMQMDSVDLDLDSANITQTLTALSNVFTNGLSINSMPSAVKGYAKFSQLDAENENAMVAALVVGEIAGNRTVIGGGYTSINPSAEYYEFSCPIFRLDYINQPTELILFALCSTDSSQATNSGTLYLDDLSVSYESSLIEIEQSSNKIYLYPNPTESDFKISNQNNSSVTIKNVLGQTILHKDNYSSSSTLSIKDKGVYFVQTNQNGMITTTKLIIR